MSDAKHSPLPWGAEYGFVGAARRLFVVADGADGFLPATDADAELIVRAVNNHAALVAALESLVGPDLTYLNGTVMTGCITRSRVLAARAALRLAKGGAP